MNRREFLGAVPSAAAALSAAQRGTDNAPRPNIVFIMTDDQRWDNMGCAGHPYLKTPNMDRLRREGAMFKNALSPPRCARRAVQAS